MLDTSRVPHGFHCLTFLCTHLVSPLAGVVLAFSFMFGNSVRQTYENVVFLFAVHPYDIGENLIVDDQLLTVDEITINFTCFTNGLGQKVWYPNQKLLGNPFINVTTSKNKGESITILVDMDTPSTTIEALETALKAYAAAQSKEIEALSVNVGSAAVPLKITISIYFRLTHPGIDGERTGRVRTAMYKRMAEEMTRLGVQYTWPPVKGLGAGPAAAAAAARAVANGGAANALPQF